jgi:hypothetical protein
MRLIAFGDATAVTLLGQGHAMLVVIGVTRAFDTYERATVRAHKHALKRWPTCGLELARRDKSSDLDPVTHLVNMQRGAHAMKTASHDEEHLFRSNGRGPARLCRAEQSEAQEKLSSADHERRRAQA